MSPRVHSPVRAARSTSGRRWRRSRADVLYDQPGAHQPGLAGGVELAGEVELDFGLPTPAAGEQGGGWLPDRVEVGPRVVCVNGRWAATLVVLGYPAEVSPGWLEPLASYPARVEIGLHIDPVPPEVAARQLRRQLARLESSRHADATNNRLVDPIATAAAQDAHELSERLARAETRLHRVGIAITVHADTPTELGEHLTALTSLAASLLVEARPATFRALQGWTSTLPIGVDGLGHRRAMDTDATAALFPFASPELPGADPASAATPSGVLFGHNIATNSLVIYDRMAQPNYNLVVLGTSGSGKSYTVKLEILRSLYRGIHSLVIDPEDEYAALAATVGGAHLRLGAPGVRVNPLDLPNPTTTGPGAAGADVLTRRALWLHTVLGVLIGPLTPAESAIADVGIHTCYRTAGITPDPATWARPAPLLADLQAALAAVPDPMGGRLATRLTPFTEGSFSGLFAGPTTTRPESHVVVWSLKDLPEQLHSIGTLLALDATWRTVADPYQRRPRYVVVDEAWLLLAHDAGAQFLLRLAKAARKHWAGLTLVTQDVGDVLGSELGRAVVSNAATTLLLRTAPQAAARVADAYSLSEGEIAALTSAEVGCGLLLSGTRHRVALRGHASVAEDLAVTTDPAQLAHHPTDPAAAPHGRPHARSSSHRGRVASHVTLTRAALGQAEVWAQEGPDPL